MASLVSEGRSQAEAMNKFQAGAVALLGLFAATAALAAPRGDGKTHVRWVGQGQVNIVDFRGGDAS
jgi:hypothetical protein